MSTTYTGTYTKVSTDAFKKLQLNAGMLLSTFNPKTPATVADSDIICATSGGVNITAVPEYTDFADGVDNVPANILEFKQLKSWECKMSFTALNVSASVIKLALGAADIDTPNNKVTPRMSLKNSGSTLDVQDVWWVGDMNDGGFCAIKLINALSTSGFSFQSTKDDKGQISVELTGQITMDAQDTVPIEIYVIEGSEDTSSDSDEDEEDEEDET